MLAALSSGGAGTVHRQGQLAAAISNAVVGEFSSTTGRGPTQAKIEELTGRKVTGFMSDKPHRSGHRRRGVHSGAGKGVGCIASRPCGWQLVSEPEYHRRCESAARRGAWIDGCDCGAGPSAQRTASTVRP